MSLSSFVKKLYMFKVLFGSKTSKIAGIADSANILAATGVVWDTATKTITFINETSLPSWLTPGKLFRTYDGVPKTTPSSTDINYIPNVILTPNPLTNDGVLFQVLSVSGNTITVDDSGSGATPVDRDTTGLPTIITLEGRIAIVVNDANICRINGSGSTVYNIENQTPSAVPGDGSGIAAAFADHFHAALGSSSSLYLGWYTNEAALIAAHPTGTDGQFANLGSTDTMWIWDSDTSAWVDSGVAPSALTIRKDGILIDPGVEDMNFTGDVTVTPIAPGLVEVNIVTPPGDRITVEYPGLTSDFITAPIGLDEKYILDKVLVENVGGVYEYHIVTFSAIPDAGQWSLDVDGTILTFDFFSTDADITTAIQTVAGYGSVVATGDYLTGFNIVYYGVAIPVVSLGADNLTSGGLAVIIVQSGLLNFGADIDIIIGSGAGLDNYASVFTAPAFDSILVLTEKAIDTPWGPIHIESPAGTPWDTSLNVSLVFNKIRD